MKHQIPSPVKESNVKEENRKNYFPVSWRVIGGGVRVGITETEDSDLYSTANTSRPVNHSAPRLEIDTPIKMISRKRSNSNPPAPSPHSLQFKVEHVCPLFTTLFVHSNLLIFSINSYSLLNLPVYCDSPSLRFVFCFRKLLYFRKFLCCVMDCFALVLCVSFFLISFFRVSICQTSNLYREPFLSSFLSDLS